MRRFSWIPAMTTAAGIVLAVGSASAQQNTVCTTTLSSRTFENVIVPTGANCTLISGVSGLSNVIVRSGATLRILGGTVRDRPRMLG